MTSKHAQKFIKVIKIFLAFLSTFTTIYRFAREIAKEKLLLMMINQKTHSKHAILYAQGIFYVNIKKKKKKENCERKPVLTEHCIMHTTGDKK